ncbi:phosphotransferase family protein [Dolosigranulum savutiense]|uniref:Phosphotransferase family protein n=1 Tax=Dolosigranulum savutiense TaxID=3110288 RepID=A0AB74TSI0_9LACT
MSFEQETGWTLHPLNGETGQAYMGIKNEQKLFLKRNTSPFLAALSLEGISPKLVWTKRTSNGDILTAQKWCNGRTLYKKEMNMVRVAHKLKGVHSSETLKKMLKRVGGQTYRPEDCLTDYFTGLPVDLRHHPTLAQAIRLLKKQLETLPVPSDYCVCHGDASHKNWLLSDEQELYLVDWDSVVLADPAFDIGQYMARYYPQIDTTQWLYAYDKQLTESFRKRIDWYRLMVSLFDIKAAYMSSRFHKMNEIIIQVDEWIKEIM